MRRAVQLGAFSGRSEPRGRISTARLKSGADTRDLDGPSGARRDFRPTIRPIRRYAHSPLPGSFHAPTIDDEDDYEGL